MFSDILISLQTQCRHFVFPFAFSLNMFSMTALLIVLGIFSEAEIAADVGIVQAAALVVFMAFGTNARNIILSRNESITLHQFFKFRSILVLPLALIAYLLSKGFIDLANEVVFCLILRRCIEWIVELQICERELENDKRYAFLYSGIQSVTFLALLISINAGLENYYLIFLIIWSFSPGYQLMPFAKQMLTRDKELKLSWTAFMPHLGSSWIIAISTYVFRVLIILLAGKALGGLLFSAYAIGGMISSIYTYALGPSLAARKDERSSIKEWNVTRLVLLVLVLLGALIALLSPYITQSELPETQYYYLAIGLSLIGSSIMLLAQRKRIHMLQIDKDSVFVPDVLANILIISTVPFAYYLLGPKVLSGLFLWNAFLNYFIYLIPSINNNWYEKSKFKISTKNIFGFLTRSNVQICVLVLLFAPVFFQLGGDFIFNNPSMIYDHGGKLTKLPLPVSIIACFMGLILLIRYKECYSSAIFLFSFFVAMIIATFISSFNNTGDELGKIIFLIQYILPIFAMLLGQSYIEPLQQKYSLEAIFLYIIAIVIPLEVIATLDQATGILTPYLYQFSIYQHLQYMPVIFIGFYFLALISLHNNIKLRILLLLLAPFVGIYTVLSFSNLAMMMTLFGVVSSLFILTIRGYGRFDSGVSGLIILFIFLSLNMDKINLYEYESKNSAFIDQRNAYFERKKIFNPLIFKSDVIPLMEKVSYEAGVQAYENGDFETAFRKLLPLAEEGRLDAHFAMFHVANLYYEGNGVPKDFQKAKTWYTRAAERGLADAQYQLGTMYEHGIGTIQDIQKAFIWYTKAAEQGLSIAQYKLATMYADGSAVSQDDRKAQLWLNNADKKREMDISKEAYHRQHEKISTNSSDVVLSNVGGRLNIWQLYWDGITESPLLFIFGHEQRINRRVAPSAHNYYLDLTYNYGFISLLPIIVLFLYTLTNVYKSKRDIVSSPRLLVLVFLVFFYLVIDNSLKVGLRQPYPGIISFFIWGVLLTKLEQLRHNS